MKQAVRELIAVVTGSVKEVLGMGVEGGGGKSVKDGPSLLMLRHLPQGDLCIRVGLPFSAVLFT